MPLFWRIAVSTFVAVLLSGTAVEAQSPFERDRSGGGWDWCDPAIDFNCAQTYHDFNADGPWTSPWCRRMGLCDPPGQLPTCLDRDGRRCRETPPSIPPLILLPPVIIAGPTPRPNVPSSGLLGQPIEGFLVELYTGVRLPVDEPPVATAAALGAIALQVIPWVRAMAKLRGVERVAALADSAATTRVPAVETSLRSIATGVHDLASDRIRKQLSTVAVAEVRLADGTVELWAAGSSGRLSDAQRRLLAESGVTRIVGGTSHAEQNIGAALPEGATVQRWAISWGEKQKSTPCRSCGPMVEHIGGKVEDMER